ncbi:MAG: hypothetical protein AB4040_10390 [Synechococcus sp.]
MLAVCELAVGNSVGNSPLFDRGDRSSDMSPDRNYDRCLQKA